MTRGLARALSRLAALTVALAAFAACAPAPSASATAAPYPTLRPSPAAAATPSDEPTRNRATPEASPTATPGASPASAIRPGVVDSSSLEIRATYDVDLEVNVRTGDLTVTTAIEARNSSGASIDRLELNTVAARLGGLAVTAASVDGRPVEVAIDDQTLVVPLGGILAAGATARVRLSYAATLRRDLDGSDWLFSRVGGTLALYRWIPWVSRAVPFDRPNHGDPFVTPTSPSVRIRVTTNAPMVLAATGASRDDGPVSAAPAQSWSFEAHDVRDVAIVLAPDFQITADAVDGVEIRAYTRPGGLDGARLVTLARQALSAEAGRIGVPYPWPAYTLVETAGGYGMESPTETWIPKGTASGNLVYLVHHETAHQWFYGLVGNDQQAEPFADEATADLLARTVLGSLRASRCDAEPLDRSITRYSRSCYYEVVYIQGANVLDELRQTIGSDRFWATLRNYVEAHRFGFGGTSELLERLRAASPSDLLPIIESRFPTLY